MKSVAVVADQDVFSGASAYDAKNNVYWLTYATNKCVISEKIALTK